MSTDLRVDIVLKVIMVFHNVIKKENDFIVTRKAEMKLKTTETNSSTESVIWKHTEHIRAIYIYFKINFFIIFKLLMVSLRSAPANQV